MNAAEEKKRKEKLFQKRKAEYLARRKKELDKVPWVDKYRPRNLKEIIGHEEVKKVLYKSISNGDLPHLLFHGSSGTGKTSTILALVMQLYGPRKVNSKILELNASDERGINIVREKIISFANIVVGTDDPKYPSPPFKIVILDEVDAMTSEAQTALKKVMETTCDVTRFVLICNYISKIIEPIASRCASFRFKPIEQDIMIKKLKVIAENEGMNVDKKALVMITKICKGDARRSITTLQNLKYLVKNGNIIKKKHVYQITSYVDPKKFTQMWDRCLNADISTIQYDAMNIINTGYPLTYMLIFFKNMVLSSDIEDNKKAKICIYLGNIERMIMKGSDNYIQLLSVMLFINAINKDHNIEVPSIF